MGVAWEVGPETPLSIAEVGCGTGYTGSVLAAGNPNSRVLGLDYNPAHIAEARSMASAAGLENIQFLDADLAELQGFELDRLPEFDLITVHGVWSWVSDAVRDGILRLIRTRLKPGGIVMISYNSLPGAASALGLSRLVRDAMMRADDDLEGLDAASKLAQRLVSAEAANLPSSVWRRIVTREQAARPDYVRHEFMTEHWRPAFFADVASALSSARCEFVGSATIDENFPEMSLTAEQAALWNEAPNTASRQLIFDMCVQRAFRRDVFVRGLRRVARDPIIDAIWMTPTSREDGEVKLSTQAGVASLPPHVIDPVRTSLAEGPRTIGELRRLPGCSSVTPAELLCLLIGSGCAVPLWRDPNSGDGWAAANAAARRLNKVAVERLANFGTSPAQFALATPALGGGLTVGSFELAVASLCGTTDAADQDPAALARRVVPPGPLPDSSILADLEQTIGNLLRIRRPVWQALGII